MTTVGVVCIFFGFLMFLVGGGCVLLFQFMTPLTHKDIEVLSKYGFFCVVSNDAVSDDVSGEECKNKFYLILSWILLCSGVILACIGGALLGN